MKKSLFLMFTAMLACTVFMASCSDDDNQELLIPQTFSGKVTSVIPAFADFDGAVSDVKATLTWVDAAGTTCTIDLGAFNVHIERPELPRPMDFVIGPMSITGVKSVKGADGSYTFSSESFDCVAGQYEVKGGTLEGTLKSGALQFKISYKPGSMPFQVVSTFAGAK